MKICVPIRAKSVVEAKKMLRQAEGILCGVYPRAAGAQDDKRERLLEIWLDNIPEMEIVTFIRAAKLPVIAVCRTRLEKGSFKGSEKQRIEILKEAIAAGAAFADIGMHTAPRLIGELKKQCKKNGAHLIISKHFWKKMPQLRELEQTAARARRLGADIVKIAAQVRDWPDNVKLFELTKRLTESGQPAIIIGMGEKGKISRIGCPLLGSYLTYAALDEKSKTAPGQVTLQTLLTPHA